MENLSFEVPQGRLFALLGPNGASKTTTVRLLLGLIVPTPVAQGSPVMNLEATLTTLFAASAGS